jgi:transcriptional regulator NrdR family protein
MRNCPDCKTKLITTQTRTASQSPTWTRRRQVCENCGFRVSTIEMPVSDLMIEQADEEEDDGTNTRKKGKRSSNEDT